MAMEWERMVLGCRAGQTAEFSTIMLVSGSSMQKRGAGLAGHPPCHHHTPLLGGDPGLSMETQGGQASGWRGVSVPLLQHFAGLNLPGPPRRAHSPPSSQRGEGQEGAGKDTSRSTLHLASACLPLSPWGLAGLGLPGAGI